MVMMPLLQHQKLINASFLKIMLPSSYQKTCYDHVDNSAETFLESRLNLLFQSKTQSSFRVTRGTFTSTLGILTPYLQREALTEEQISHDERLAIFLCRMGRGYYIHIIAELFGVGDSTLSNIVLEVSLLMIEVMRDVAIHFPATDRNYINLINDFEKLWQFPYCFGAIDGWLPHSDQMPTRRSRVSQRIL